MAPSIAETTSHIGDQIHEKVAAVLSKNNKETEQKVEDAPALAVQVPETTPAVMSERQDHEARIEDRSAPSTSKSTPESQHKEPLKLSGALDSYESFDVTPVIGKEFVGVNLAEWLSAPNSDDLIRDLAITSMLYSCYRIRD